MAMYSAYFDESGHPDEGDHLTVAGVVAGVEQWVHFEREWRAALDPLGATMFHAADFGRKNGKVFDSLVGIICRRVEKTFSCTIHLEDFRAINEKYIFGEYFGFPYPTACRSCMGNTGEWVQRHKIPAEHVEYMFEDGAKDRGQLLLIAQVDRLRTPMFKKKNEAVPLQAGDLVAWLLQKYLRGELNHSVYEQALLRLEAHSHSWVQLDLSDADATAAMFSVPLRDPNRRYEFKIINAGGKRHAVIHHWPASEKEPRIERETVNIPDPEPLRIAAPFIKQLRHKK